MVKALHGSVLWRLVSILLILPGSLLAQTSAPQIISDASAAIGGRDRGFPCLRSNT